MSMWIGYDKPSKDIVQLYKIYTTWHGYTCYITYISNCIWYMTWLWLGYTGLIFYTRYKIIIYWDMTWIWLIFGSCLQSAGSYLWCCHIYMVYTVYGMGYSCYISYIGNWVIVSGIWHGYDWDILVWFFIPGIYYIYTVCILFRMRYAEYILKLKNLYIFYIAYILPGLVDVLGIYLRYDNIGDILLQNVATLVYVQVIGYMRTGREFKKIVWICSFFAFPTR